ncbi:MAG: pyruvate dehydrogenase (acetyl-transferring) E1 component subunit alpha [Actinomycetota bacterium]|nr:pyruvate dehydrogenase (acetyl-transferring) E1 component subunit alpha [Actinomycetota bacterium]
MSDLAMLRTMLLIRRFEERAAQLYGESKIRGFLHLCIGEEAVAVGVSAALEPDDNVVSTYREHGHALVRGVGADAVMAEMFGRSEGCSGGRGGSMHLFDVQHRFFGGNAIVGGGLPVAVGLALADHLRGVQRTTVCLFGEGAMAEGEFHESVNLATLWHLPVVFCCENNLYAMGSALTRTEANTDLVLKAAAYGLAAWSADGMDVRAVHDAMRRAVTTVRDGSGPVFVEMRTYRFRAHSMYDPELYRSKDEVAEWKHRDPIDLEVGRLRVDGLLDDAGLSALQDDVQREVEAAVLAAENGTDEPVEQLTRHVYADAAEEVRS